MTESALGLCTACLIVDNIQKPAELLFKGSAFCQLHTRQAAEQNTPLGRLIV